MTEKLYETDSHIKSFEASVVKSGERGGKFYAVLDKTAFFPEGGGQASDKGKIGNVNVYDVQIIDGEILHYTDEKVEESIDVNCRIDWKRRFRNMQNHSGEHILSGIIHKLYGYDNVGFHLGEDYVTMDISGVLDRTQLCEIERMANEAVYENAAFTAYYPTADELVKTDYRSKSGIEGNVRLVKIEGYDICACCAPHVKSASEIGIIKILDFHKLRGGIRMFIRCGTDALEDYNERYSATAETAEMLSLKQDETVRGVRQLLEQTAELKSELSDMRKRLIELKVNSFNGSAYETAIFEDGFNMKELQLTADRLYKRLGGIRAVFSGADNKYDFAVCGEPDELDKFFDEFKHKFEVKGGGRNGMVQGTVIATGDELSAYFKK